ncbi:MAG: threonine synthase [Clostridiales Family XIII bacterium]|jgi:threonine synthase|nr:threonine synthase [Clostridiales Family XIII bacterium]
MEYISTRGDETKFTGAQAIIQGLAPDKGLFVPTEIPKIDYDFSGADGAAGADGSRAGADAGKTGVPYRDVAYRVMSAFLDDFTDEELRRCIDGAYDDKFDSPEISPVVKTERANFIELYHGRTAAFKDMALSILPHLLTTSVRKENENRRIVILTATSGDTGKAALEGFADVEGTEIFVFYPKDGVSEIQERQMVTQGGANTHVYAIEGNFDDAQNAVKAIMGDRDYKAALSDGGYRLSSANSINIGRLVPQVAYYYFAYVRLVERGEIASGDDIIIVVPTGNFGNILAAWYAREAGLPVGRLVCASNENRVLTDLIGTGVYDANREFILTSSPSMDILISSNLERLLWHLSGGDSDEIAGYMRSLESERRYEVSARVREGIRDFMWGGSAVMERSHSEIGELWAREGYLMDTHTSVAYRVYLDYLEKTGDDTPAVIASTASAYKFARRVAGAIGLGAESDGFAYIDALNAATGIPVPAGLRGLRDKEIRHRGVVTAGEMADAIRADLARSRGRAESSSVG